ncbi:MAG TPA: helix-turn-helix domain-containing protein [Thermoanaerobaculia bacterium]|jgi:AcrR family transcriptional regulator|nr:helix-turn-helix domain-containing protein [Thermoanaerobaculia bacterium]
MKRAPRGYTKVRRAEAEEATRGRIVSAMVALHEELGPARTTVSAIAERAGVERLTVYRHFPDESSMLHACSSHWSSLHPPPEVCDVGRDPASDCRRTILRLYVWYRANVAMLTNIETDTPRIPLIATLMAPFASHLDGMAAELNGRWPRRSARRAATIRHALEFSTWRSLDRITGSDRGSAALAASWVSDPRTS